MRIVFILFFSVSIGITNKKKNPSKILKYNMPFFSQKGAFYGPSKSLNISISGALILQKYLPKFQGP